MSFYLSTTGTLDPVVLNDLGQRSFPHPTVDYDLMTEYMLGELLSSVDLDAALTAGYITLKNDSGVLITDLGAVGAGDVLGPSTSLDNAIPRFDGTTGTCLQGSGVRIDDSNNLHLGDNHWLYLSTGTDYGIRFNSSGYLQIDGADELCFTTLGSVNFGTASLYVENIDAGTHIRFKGSGTYDRYFGYNNADNRYNFDRNVHTQGGLQADDLSWIKDGSGNMLASFDNAGIQFYADSFGLYEPGTSNIRVYAEADASKGMLAVMGSGAYLQVPSNEYCYFDGPSHAKGIRWNSASDRFELGANVYTAQDLIVLGETQLGGYMTMTDGGSGTFDVTSDNPFTGLMNVNKGIYTVENLFLSPNQRLYFDTTGSGTPTVSKSVRWNSSVGAIEWSDSMYVPPDGHYYLDSDLDKGLSYNSTAGQVELAGGGNDIHLMDTVVARGNIVVDVNDIYIAADSKIWFDYGTNTKSLEYDAGNTRFEFNDRVFANGAIQAAGGFQVDSDVPSTFDTAKTRTLQWSSLNSQFEFNSKLKVNGTLTVGAYTLPTTDGSSGQTLTTDGLGNVTWAAGSGSGDVVGPASATDTAIVRFDGTTGKLIQDSGILIDASDNMVLGLDKSIYFNGAAKSAGMAYSTVGGNELQIFGADLLIAQDLKLWTGELYFDDAKTHALIYDSATDNRFEFNDDVYTSENFNLDANKGISWGAVTSISYLTAGGNRLSLAPDNNANLDLVVQGTGLVRIGNPSGTFCQFDPDGDFHTNNRLISFDTTRTKWLYWDEGGARFRFNDDLYSEADMHVSGDYRLDNGHSIIMGTRGNITAHGSNNYINIGGNVRISDAYTLPNADGSSGQVLTTNGLGSVSWGTPSAVPAMLQGSEEALDSTTNTSWTQAWRYSPTLEVATYLVWYYCEYTSSSGSYRVHVRVQIDDTTTIAEGAFEPEALIASEIDTMGGVFFFTSASAGVHNFDFDFYTEGATAYIRSKRIVLMKVT